MLTAVRVAAQGSQALARLLDGRERRQPGGEAGDPQDVRHLRLRRDQPVTAPRGVGVVGHPHEGTEPTRIAEGQPVRSSSNSRAWPAMAAHAGNVHEPDGPDRTPLSAARRPATGPGDADWVDPPSPGRRGGAGRAPGSEVRRPGSTPAGRATGRALRTILAATAAPTSISPCAQILVFAEQTLLDERLRSGWDRGRGPGPSAGLRRPVPTRRLLAPIRWPGRAP